MKYDAYNNSCLINNEIHPIYKQHPIHDFGDVGLACMWKDDDLETTLIGRSNWVGPGGMTWTLAAEFLLL